MAKKSAPKSAKKLGIPQELLEDLVSHITLDEMEFGDAECALETLKARLGELAMLKVLENLEEEDSRPKACPKCKMQVPVKVRDKERTILTMSGEHTIKRNYHWCSQCRFGFYPRDIKLGLSERGEYSPEMEKRILDFGVNETYEECAERFALHYESRVSSNGFRQVVRRMGAQLESSYEDELQLELFEAKKAPPKILYVMQDGSMLPTREGWKESKVGLVFRDDQHIKGSSSRRGLLEKARYCAVLGGQGEFFQAMQTLLEVEHAERAKRVVWLADGAQGNWTLAKACCKYAIQILDIWHAIENGVEVGRELLGADSDMIELWKKRLSQLLLAGDFQAMIHELMDCIIEADDPGLKSLNKLVTYYRNNETRMNYKRYLEMGLCVGSGAIESAHRHVLQKRMKLAGQHWSMPAGRQMVRLRAAYRTGGSRKLHRSVHRAYRRSIQRDQEQRRALRLVA